MGLLILTPTNPAGLRATVLAIITVLADLAGSIVGLTKPRLRD